MFGYFGPDVAPGECGCLSPAAGSPDLHQASGVSRYLERMWLMKKHEPVFFRLSCVRLTCSHFFFDRIVT